MARPRKTRSDSATAAIDAIVAVSQPDLAPPAHMPLRPEALEFWPGIIHARARAEWRTVDLVVAAQLADCQACIRDETNALHAEGSVLKNERGTMVANPRASILEALARREMALMRTLLMGGKDGGDARNFKGSRAMESSARKAKDEMQESEDLLA
jgi:hypothetical protein